MSHQAEAFHPSDPRLRLTSGRMPSKCRRRSDSFAVACHVDASRLVGVRCRRQLSCRRQLIPPVLLAKGCSLAVIWVYGVEDCCEPCCVARVCEGFIGYDPRHPAARGKGGASELQVCGCQGFIQIAPRAFSGRIWLSQAAYLPPQVEGRLSERYACL